MSMAYKQVIPEKAFPEEEEFPVYEFDGSSNAGVRTCILYRVPTQSEIKKINEWEPTKLEVSVHILSELICPLPTITHLFLYSPDHTPVRYSIEDQFFPNLEIFETTYCILDDFNGINNKIKVIKTTAFLCSMHSTLERPKSLASFRNLSRLEIVVRPGLNQFSSIDDAQILLNPNQFRTAFAFYLSQLRTIPNFYEIDFSNPTAHDDVILQGAVIVSF